LGFSSDSAGFRIAKVQEFWDSVRIQRDATRMRKSEVHKKIVKSPCFLGCEKHPKWDAIRIRIFTMDTEKILFIK
jgi:hypothetical protein